eukprot:PhF_6_TR11583/c0_g1_i1/m.18734
MDYAEEPVAYNKAHFPEGLNGNFLNLSVEELRSKFMGANGLFESEKRDIARCADAIVETLAGLVPQQSLQGLTLLDIGAGTGLLEPLLSKALGPSGKLYANDISEGFLSILNDVISKNSLSNTVTVLGTVLSVGPIPDGSVDVVFLCDVYHHVEYRCKFMKDCARVLKPDTGRLIVIDFYRDPKRMTSHPPEWALDHIRADKDVFVMEISQVGYEIMSDIDIPGLTENYCVTFKVSNTEGGAEVEFSSAMGSEMPDDVRQNYAEECSGGGTVSNESFQSFASEVEKDFFNMEGGSEQPPITFSTTSVKVHRNICYVTPKNKDWKNQLDVYTPTEATEGQNLPVVFHVHGGGWKRGDRSYGFYGSPSVCNAMASKGVVAVAPSYHLCEYPKFMNEIVTAFRWVQANITKYGGNPQCIFVSGHSAGAHIISLLIVQPSYGLSTKDVKGVMLLSGVYSLHAPLGHYVVSWRNWWFRKRYIQITFGDDAKTIDEASPSCVLLSYGGKVAPSDGAKKKWYECARTDSVPTASGSPPRTRPMAVSIPFPMLVFNAETDLGLEIDGAVFVQLLRSLNVDVSHVVVPKCNHASLCWNARCHEEMLSYIKRVLQQ